VLPLTWVFQIKQFPDGRKRKYKARFCVRGDQQIEGVNYDENYSSVLSWSIVQLLLCLLVSKDLARKQAELGADEHIYIKVPRGSIMPNAMR
jgi:hypothetical protein